ncbi:MAG: hypothetical protein IJR83_00535 [Clostridia bacterium]|nr:hypothetical protein [Clostridia bacterium]
MSKTKSIKKLVPVEGLSGQELYMKDGTSLVPLLLCCRDLRLVPQSLAEQEIGNWQRFFCLFGQAELFVSDGRENLSSHAQFLRQRLVAEKTPGVRTLLHEELRKAEQSCEGVRSRQGWLLLKPRPGSREHLGALQECGIALRPCPDAPREIAGRYFLPPEEDLPRAGSLSLYRYMEGEEDG